jgi:hypothetical protein
MVWSNLFGWADQNTGGDVSNLPAGIDPIGQIAGCYINKTKFFLLRFSAAYWSDETQFELSQQTAHGVVKWWRATGSETRCSDYDACFDLARK